MDIANLVIRVTNEGLDRASRELRRLQENAAGAQSANQKFGDSIASLNKLAMVGFGALTAVVGGSIKTAMSFETAMAEINKTVDFTANYALSDLKKELEGLSKVMPLTFEELAAISAAGGQSGVAAEGLKDFTETIAKMAIAFDISAAETADAMAKISSSYNVPIENVKELGDAINEVSNNGAVKANEIVDFMLRVGQSASNLGIAGEAAAALGGALIDAGGSVEVVGTAMKSIFTDMSSTEWLDSMSIVLTSLGIDVKEYAKVVKTDGLAAFMMLREGIMSAENPVEVLNTLFDAAGGNAASLFSEGSKVNEMLGSVGQVAGVAATHIGSLDKEYKAMADTSANAFVLIKNSARLVAAAIGEAFLPAVREITDALIPMIQNMAAWAKENPELIVTIAKVAAAITGIIIVVAAVSAVIGTAISIFTGLSAIFALVGGELALLGAALASPLFIVAALATAGYLLYKNWDTLIPKANELADVIVNGFVGAFNDAVAAANAWADEIVESFLSVVDSTVSAMNSWADSVINGFISGFNNIIAAANAWADNVVGSVKSAFTSMIAAANAWATGIVNSVKTAFNSMVSAIKSSIGNAKSTAVNGFNDIKNSIINTLKELPSKLLQIGKDIVQGLINGIKNGAGAVGAAMSSMAKDAVARFKSVFDINSPSKVMDKIGDRGIAGGTVKGVKRGSKRVVSAVQKMAEDAIKATQDAITGIDKELALFGNTSKVADIKYDISIGKFGGNTGTLVAKATELESAKKMADIQSQLVAYSKMIYDNSTYLPGELTKISYELDEVEGKFYGASEASKELLRTGAALADQSKAEGVATSMMIDNLRELALLQTDGSDYAKLAYDLQDVSNALYVLDDATKQRLLTDDLAIKAAKQTKASNDAITDSIESLDKQIALFGNNDAVEELLYDMVELGKYAGASADNINKLFAATEKLAALNAEKAFKGVLDDNADDKSPIGKIMQEYDDKLAIIKAYEDSHTALLQESVAARLEIEGAYNDARSIMMLSSGEAVFGSLSGLAKNFLGEQSGTYKAMYALQKAFTLSSAIMSSKKAVMDAWANTPGSIWAKAFAAGKVVVSTGAITSAIAGLSPQGFKQGGYTGTMGVNDVAGVVHGQEYVFDAQATKRIGVDNLNAMRRGDAPKSGGDVIINNYSSAKIEQRQDANGVTILEVRDEIHKSWNQLQNPNSHPSKMVNRNVQAPRRR